MSPAKATILVACVSLNPVSLSIAFCLAFSAICTYAKPSASASLSVFRFISSSSITPSLRVLATKRSNSRWPFSVFCNACSPLRNNEPTLDPEAPPKNAILRCLRSSSGSS